MISIEPTPEALAAEVLDTMPLVMYYIRSYVRRETKSSSSIPQVRVLAFIKRRPGSSLSELAEALGVTKATASTLVERMVQKRLVKRTEDPKERRCIVLTLTKEGEVHLAEVRDLAIGEVARILKDLPAQKLRKIHEGMALLHEVFGVTGNGMHKEE